MQQIDLTGYALFKKHLSNFHETSASDDTPPIYVTVSTQEAINFDKVTREKCSLNFSKSVDALSCVNKKLYFIEFKSGRTQSVSKRNGIYRKAEYSNQLFCDIVGMDSECFAHNAVFALVYDLGKNPSLQRDEHYIDGESVSKLQFIEYFSSKAKKNPKMFNIMELQGRLYKKVFLYKKEDFEHVIGSCNVGMIANILSSDTLLSNSKGHM